ncbi:adenine deaminase [Methanogenium organophilum]|uniref:Adenine deaminase n=1 Tax=Methanogenium organophilum TaxID=2199 RepID=A0A9X9S4B9_METOG|nr:adenine deaminase [Methanogenium organophilum]WAI01502.1 adenine deaminase [Methanogenium organophilum]
MGSLIQAAVGTVSCDTVFINARVFCPFTGEWEEDARFGVKDGCIAGFGNYSAGETIDLRGKRVIPGLVDAHVHIESSLLTPAEYARAVIPHGTTTVFADPHEIANVAGIEGLRYMLRQRAALPLDIRLMLPSCVPATPLDRGGAVLSCRDLAAFTDEEGVLGIGEVMNVPGVLAEDDDLLCKIGLSTVVDGHAPLLSGEALCAYIAAGIQSEHECTGAQEAAEKLRRGMYLMLREGSTEKNLSALAAVVTPATAPRCSFATDDRHADMLAEDGHIDDCIRRAVATGIEPETAYRMATLSAAERFGLNDRGALSPGRRADFCVLDDNGPCTVTDTYIQGVRWIDPGYRRPDVLHVPFSCAPLTKEAIAIRGSGTARVVGLVPGQILTRTRAEYVDGASVPDPSRDLLKLVVCDRYRSAGCGVGIVKGFGIRDGAIAASVAHDSHNLIAVGSDDDSIIRAAEMVIASDGGMAAVSGNTSAFLPLECGGLMSSLPYDEVAESLRSLEACIHSAGCIANPFMYLSFCALTVIPEIRVTERGVFDVGAFADVPLFSSRVE